ncbi:MAG: hypothetical protein ACK4KW_10910 [Gemmobacter sp.]
MIPRAYMNLTRSLMPRNARQAVRARGRQILNRFGCDVVSAMDPVNLCDLGLSVEDAYRRAGSLPFVMDVPVEHVRHLEAAAFPVARDGGSPFVETALQYVQNPDLGYEESALKRFYDRFQPQTNGDFLGLPRSPERHFLLTQHRALTLYPWDRPPLTDYRRHISDRLAGVALENEEHGALLDHRHGLVSSGPVSPEKGALELSRLKRVVDRIRESGFRHSGDVRPVRVVALRRGESCRYLCRAGHHRVAAFSALGGTSLPVWPYPRPVVRDDVDKWPGVTAGVFSRDAALFVFDRMFEGRQPEFGG